MGNKINVLPAVPQAATYGGVPGVDGAGAARDKWWEGMGNNDAQQGQVDQASAYAAKQAAANRPPPATQDPYLANNAAGGAGGNQQGAIDLAGQLASGNQPSQGAMQLQSGLNQAAAQQTAMSRSARGAAGLATAGSDAQANTADLQQNAYLQGGLLRSKDMAAGRGMLANGLSQQRDQNGQMISQGNQLAQSNQSENDQYRLGMGSAAVGLGQAANGQSQQDLQWYQGGMAPVDAQSEANQQRQRWVSDQRKQVVAANTQDK